jgi:hypothetical protein
MKPHAILLCIAATIFGIASPFVAGVFGDGPLHVWFHVLPTAVDQWLWPQGDVLMVAVAMVVFTVQYLLLFGVATAIAPLVRLTLDFLAGPRHRGGLVGPRR